MINIRKAEESDLESLSQLAQLCFIDTFGNLYTKENLFTHLQETCSVEYFRKNILEDQILLAENDSLVGYIKFGDVGLPLDNIPEKSKEIQRLYIHPDFKRKHIGSKLMQLAFEDPILQESKHHYLSVYEDNIDAQKFYQNYGFSIVGEYDYYVGSHIDREYIMHRKNS